MTAERAETLALLIDGDNVSSENAATLIAEACVAVAREYSPHGHIQRRLQAAQLRFECLSAPPYLANTAAEHMHLLRNIFPIDLENLHPRAIPEAAGEVRFCDSVRG